MNAMSDREICGVCQGTWPCSCSASAVPVVMMSADDNLAASLARRMGSERNDPLTIVPIEPESPLAVYDYGRGEDFDKFCGHRSCQYDVDMDKREVVCRQCGTALDPFFVFAQLGHKLRGESMRLQAAQELERREAVREAERKARAAVRRHRYAPYLYDRRGKPEYCATCGGQQGDVIHAR